MCVSEIQRYSVYHYVKQEGEGNRDKQQTFISENKNVYHFFLWNSFVDADVGLTMPSRYSFWSSASLSMSYASCKRDICGTWSEFESFVWIVIKWQRMKKRVTVCWDSQISVWRLWWPDSQPDVCFQHPASRPRSHDLDLFMENRRVNFNVLAGNLQWKSERILLID